MTAERAEALEKSQLAPAKCHWTTIKGGFNLGEPFQACTYNPEDDKMVSTRH
jgi:hypothetical protein